jgi:hypothetical protein
LVHGTSYRKRALNKQEQKRQTWRSIAWGRRLNTLRNDEALRDMVIKGKKD